MAASDAMRRFRELHDQLKAQLSDLSQAEQEGNGEGGSETGAGRAAAQRTYEELVACLNSNGMSSLGAGRHDEALKFLSIAKDVVTADACSGFEAIAGLSSGKLKAVTLNNLGCFYKTTGRPHLALQYCYSALEIEREMEDGLSMSSTHLNLCSILSAMKKHSEAYEHAEDALRLVEESEATAGGPAGISLRAVAYHNMAVQLEAMNMLAKAVEMLTLASKAAREELGADSPIALSLDKQRARKERALLVSAARSKARASARNGHRRSTQPEHQAGAERVAAGRAGIRSASPRYGAYRPGSARELRSSTPSSGQAGATPRGSARRRRPHSAHPVRTARVAPAPTSRRPRPASANVIGIGGTRPTSRQEVHDGRGRRLSAGSQSKPRPVSARPYQPALQPPGLVRARAASAGPSRPTPPTAPRTPAERDQTDVRMDSLFREELQKIRGKIENERLVTPEFLQTINDCAQHYYFTNSNAQYRYNSTASGSHS